MSEAMIASAGGEQQEVAMPSARVAARPAKLVNVERLRIVAALGIVGFHALPMGNPWKTIGYSGLPIFLMVFSALTILHPHYALGRFAMRKVYRLLLPWVFWSFIYLVAKAAKSVITHESIDLLGGNSLLIGTSLHLWYLPYAFSMSFLVLLCQYLGRRFAGLPWVPVYIGVGLCGYVLCLVVSKINLPAPAAQWLFGLPGVLFGLAIGYIHCLQDMRKKTLLYSVLFGLVVVTSLIAYWGGVTRIPLCYSLGLFGVIVCFLWAGKPDRFTLPLSQLTYGIYLIHPLLISVFSLFLEGTNLLLVAAVYLSSAVITLLLLQSPLRMMVGAEARRVTSGGSSAFAGLKDGQETAIAQHG